MKSRRTRTRDVRALRSMLERIALACAIVPAAIVDACSTSSPAANDVAQDASIAIADSGSEISDASDSGLACAPITVAVDASNPDGGVECGIFEQFSCSLASNVSPRSDCYFELNDCPALCPGLYFFNCRAYGNWCVDGSVLPYGERVPLDDGSTAAQDPVIVECQTCPYGAGRRPHGLVAGRGEGRTALGRYLAETARLEEASIAAFVTMRAELRSFGAPASLLRACTRAAKDEARHARVTSRLARAHGALPARARVEPMDRSRSLEEIALENAVEGCVRETFGALVATWQAKHAADESIARAMRSIAEDETRHAALSWQVARWATKRLDRAARKRIARAAKRSVRALEQSTKHEPAADVVELAGAPDARTAHAMWRSLTHEAWREITTTKDCDRARARARTRRVRD